MRPVRDLFRIIIASCVLSGIAHAEPGPSAPVPQTLAKDAWLIPGGFLRNRQPDGNSVIFKAKTGLVVFDTGRHAWHRQAILDFAKAQGAPIVAIVNSHWHLDHVSGNPALKSAYPEARVYASNAIHGALSGFLKESAAAARTYLDTPDIPGETAEDIRNDLATTEHGQELAPDSVVTVSARLALGGRDVEVYLAPHAATAGDVWIFDPESRLALAGDLVTLPVPFLDTACVAGWKAAFAQIWSTPFELLVPGHGKPMSRAEFSMYRGAFDGYIDCANSSRDASECSAAWLRDVGPLLKSNGMEPKQAAGMAGYYASEVLRANRGNSKFCQAPG